MWKTLACTGFFKVGSPPDMGGRLKDLRDIEIDNYPHLVWIDCGQVIQILSTGSHCLRTAIRPNIRREAGGVIPDMVVRRLPPHYPHPLRLLLNHESYIINA